MTGRSQKKVNCPNRSIKCLLGSMLHWFSPIENEEGVVDAKDAARPVSQLRHSSSSGDSNKKALAKNGTQLRRTVLCYYTIAERARFNSHNVLTTVFLTCGAPYQITLRQDLAKIKILNACCYP